MNPTPETDAEAMHDYVLADFARKLERERDEARAALSGRTVSCSQCNESARTIAAMREAIKDAHAAIGGCLKYILRLPLSGSDAECETTDDAHHALRKLQFYSNEPPRPIPQKQSR
jgi:hypothetical protein